MGLCAAYSSDCTTTCAIEVSADARACVQRVDAVLEELELLAAEEAGECPDCDSSGTQPSGKECDTCFGTGKVAPSISYVRSPISLSSMTVAFGR